MYSVGGAYPFIELSDRDLLAQVEVHTFRASGPGGQKRNKTESAVRLVHKQTRVSAQATESRSQHENRSRALRRLRIQLALSVRDDATILDPYEAPDALTQWVKSGGKQPGRKQPALAVSYAGLLDLFCAADCSVRDSAERLGVSTSKLSKLVTGVPELLSAINRYREERGLKPLRASR